MRTADSGQLSPEHAHQVFADDQARPASRRGSGSVARLGQWGRRQERAYGRDDGVLGGYLTLSGTYLAGTATAVALAAALKRSAPSRLTPWQMLQLIVATHKIARTISKDAVTSPMRAPFTEFVGASAPGELTEEVRGTGLQHAAGELITCPMCLAQWVATALLGGLTLAPLATRLVIETFSVVAGADFLQHLYVRLQQSTE